jgi:hypothetical protein
MQGMMDLSLLKMLKHGRVGVPMEVMGLMLGDFVDEYTVCVVDVFDMPQSGTGVSVEVVDPVFQMKMIDMLKQTLVSGFQLAQHNRGQCYFRSAAFSSQLDTIVGDTLERASSFRVTLGFGGATIASGSRVRPLIRGLLVC